MKTAVSLIIACALGQILAGGLASGQILTHGPVVGGVTGSNANVFIRTDQAASVQLRYGTDPNLFAYQLSETHQTNSSKDFTQIIALDGLSAEATFYINVVVNGVPQIAAPPYPSFTTFPPSGSSRSFKFVVLTDFTNTQNLTSTVQTFASVAAENPAFVFIGGDFDHRGPKTLDAKRQMFKDLYDPRTPYMSGFVPHVLRKTPIIHQWDDHDAGLNNLDKTYPDWNLTQQVFQEYVPSYPLPSVNPGIWQKFSYAQVDCFVLDCRSQRDPETDPDNANKSMLDGNNLGATGELQWLKDGLLASSARWKIIFTSVIINPTTKVPDNWGGYQTEWNSLRDFTTTNNIQGVVFISGDLHLGAIDNGANAGFPEMCIVQPNGLGGCPTFFDYGLWSEGYYTGCSGYGSVTILQNPDRLMLRIADQSGNTQISYTITNIAPSIMTEPLNRTVTEGQSTKFSVTVTGTTPLSYQWMKNGVNISGANKTYYTTPATTAADNGALFAAVVSNSVGSVTSNNATLTVKPPPTPPVITTQPASKTVSVGQSAKFSVIATGGSLRYQWMKNGANMIGATKSSYTTSATTAGDNGSRFAVTVSNSAGTATSNGALLTVTP